MSEVDGPKFSVNQVNFRSIPKQGQEIPSEPTESSEPKIKDFSDPKAEALGRSMLVKDADNTDNDLKTLLKHPEIAENSDKMFEASYNASVDAGVKNPYEEAATFSTDSLKK